MIVRELDDGGILVLHQRDHAHLCGPLVDAWAGDVPHRAQVSRAAAIHDDGWRLWDEAPGVDADGRPHTYRNMPPGPYRRLWEQGVEDALAEGHLIGLLVSLHGSRFFHPDRGPGYRAFAEEQRHLQAKLLGDLGLGGTPDDLPPDVAFARQLLAFLDGLSLFLCERWPSPWDATVALEPAMAPRTVRVARDGGGEGATLDPFPFREPRTVSAPAYRLDRARFRDDGDFRDALEGAERVEMSWRLRPAA